jgi:conjugative relaxase-like TrwC/TraI family protein
MLSIKAIKSSAEAEDYFTKDNYYTRSKGVEESQWYGKGAQALGLDTSKQVDPTEFKELLDGRHEGKKLRTIFKGEKKKPTLAFDFTLSAPKSVSLAGLVNSDKEVLRCHDEAVKEAIRYFEKNHAATRIQTDKHLKQKQTGNIVAAIFKHDSSRELDPQLHSHAVVVNMTQTEKGWKSLDGKEIFKEDMTLFLGQVYRSALARNLMEQGYTLKHDMEKGTFEIEGYSQEQLDTFSKRANQIKETGAEGTKGKQAATLKTRKPKEREQDREMMQQRWQNEAQRVGIQHPERKPPEGKEQSQQISVESAVKYSIEHNMERSVSVTREKLAKDALVWGAGRLGGAEVLDTIQQKIKVSELLQAPDRRLTTAAARWREVQTIEILHKGQGAVEAMTSPESIRFRLKDKGLTTEQENAVLMAATTTDRITGWQGVGGSGKTTYALQELKRIAEEGGYTVKGFAPSADTARTLKKDGTIPTETVSALLVRKSEPLVAQANGLDRSAKKEIWVVDEAGMISADQGHKLLAKSEQEGARVLLMGDIKQLSAVEAGNPFKNLQAHGMQTAHLEQSQRQKNLRLKEAVQMARAGEAGKALELIGKTELNIEQINSRVAEDYLKLTPEQRKATVIVTATHATREGIIWHIREGLKKEGILQGAEVDLDVLKSRNWTKAQKGDIRNFKTGDVLEFSQRSQKIEKGVRYKVHAVNQELGEVRLSSQGGAEPSGRFAMVTIDLARTRGQGFEVYEGRTLRIAEGDQLKFLKNDTTLGKVNGQRMTVVGIEGTNIQIRNEDGTHEFVKRESLRHTTHDYVLTNRGSQGREGDSSFYVVEMAKKVSISLEAAYVALSRSRHESRVYTDDLKGFEQEATKSKANESSLEVLQEGPYQPKEQRPPLPGR